MFRILKFSQDADVCWDFEVDAWSRFWSRFMFELVIWLQEVTLARWTQPSGPLCLWQCFVYDLLHVLLHFLLPIITEDCCNEGSLSQLGGIRRRIRRLRLLSGFSPNSVVLLEALVFHPEPRHEPPAGHVHRLEKRESWPLWMSAMTTAPVRPQFGCLGRWTGWEVWHGPPASWFLVVHHPGRSRSHHLANHPPAWLLQPFSTTTNFLDLQLIGRSLPSQEDMIDSPR